MKRKLFIIISIIFCLLLSACGNKKDNIEQQKDTENITQQKDTENITEENFTDIEDVIIFQATIQTEEKTIINQENGKKEVIEEEIPYNEYEGYYRINAYYFASDNDDERVQLSITDNEGNNIAHVYVPYEVWKQWGEIDKDFFVDDVCYFKQSSTGLQAYKLIEQ